MPETDWVNPRRRRHMADIGMWLFLGALAMLFAAGLMLYVLVRTGVFGEGSIRQFHIHLPQGLWFSTVVIIAGSYAIHRALQAVSHERQQAFRRWLGATLALAGVFVILQIPSLAILIQEHFELLRQASRIGERPNAFYGFIFVLIALHALHVVGGIIALIILGIHGFRGDYDHEHYDAVRHAAMYWHFLDIVWIILFLVIWGLS